MKPEAGTLFGDVFKALDPELFSSISTKKEKEKEKGGAGEEGDHQRPEVEEDGNMVLDSDFTASDVETLTDNTRDDRDKTSMFKMAPPTKDSPPKGFFAPGGIPYQIVSDILPPLISQLRSSIRNSLLWICSGLPGTQIADSVIKINGSDSYYKDSLLKDRTVVYHEDGSLPLFLDIFDTSIPDALLSCFKQHLVATGKGFEELFWKKVAESKEFLIMELSKLTGIPRFLIPFTFDEPQTGHAGASDSSNNSDSSMPAHTKETATSSFREEREGRQLFQAQEEEQKRARGGEENIRELIETVDTGKIERQGQSWMQGQQQQQGQQQEQGREPGQGPQGRISMQRSEAFIRWLVDGVIEGLGESAQVGTGSDRDNVDSTLYEIENTDPRSSPREERS